MGNIFRVSINTLDGIDFPTQPIRKVAKKHSVFAVKRQLFDKPLIVLHEFDIWWKPFKDPLLRLKINLVNFDLWRDHHGPCAMGWLAGLFWRWLDI